MAQSKTKKKVTDIPIIGDVDDWEADVVRTLLELAPERECVFHIDSAGGSVYGTLAVTTLMRYRGIRATAIVLGECSSAAILLFAACQRRLVTRYSTMLFHRMRWQSEKRVGSDEAFLWAKHFEEMEKDIDELHIKLFGKAEEQIRQWCARGQYVTGTQVVAAGLAEMLEL